MVSHWFRKPYTVMPILVIWILALGVACGTSVQPTVAPADTQPRAPTVPAVTPAQPPAVPTAAPQAEIAPAGDEAAGPQYAPAFESYWNPPTAFYGEPVYGGTLRYIYEDPLEHANIWGARTGAALRYRIPTHNALIEDNPYDANAPFIPDLASGWTVHDDLQGVTFFLREGVKWHNGADLTCEDARFSFETMVTGEGITASYMQNRLTDVDPELIECVDDLTLEFRFTAPSATPTLNFGKTEAVVFNKEWFLAGGEKAMFQDSSVGTGPFIWEPGQTVGVDTQRFEKNPDYFIEELPYVDELVVFGILDESAQQAAMLAHQGDWHWVRNFGQYEQYVAHDQIMTVIRATRSSENLWMNLRKPPFDNLRVRQAIAMGMDRKAGIAVVQSGYGSEGLGLMPPGSFWAVEQEDACAIPGWCQPEDMNAQRAEARKILEEEGFTFDKTYVLTVEADNQRVGRATFIQEQLRLLGIKTEFDMVETVAYRTQSQTAAWGDLMTSTGGVAGIDDPYVGLGHYHRCTALFNFIAVGTECDQKAEALFEELGQTVEVEERKRLGQELQLHLMSQYWHVPVFWEEEAVAFWPEVRGYSHFPTPTGGFRRYHHMWIDPAHQEDKGFSGQIMGVPGGK